MAFSRNLQEIFQENKRPDLTLWCLMHCPGGVLFSLEEGASFWNQRLTWRIVSSHLAGLLSHSSDFRSSSVPWSPPTSSTSPWASSLMPAGRSTTMASSTSASSIELTCHNVIFQGGLMGAFFNYLNYKLTLHRMRSFKAKWLQVIETFKVTAMTVILGYTMIIYVSDCQPIEDDKDPRAALQRWSLAVAAMWGAGSLMLYCLCYQLLTCWTYGLTISSGVFIPSLLVGACWGRLASLGLAWLFPQATWVDPSKFALIGAAANLGGVVRMTISLTVILLEATGNISLGLPVMIALLVAKWVGDHFNDGLYDIHIRLNQVPLLHWDPPPHSHNIFASLESTPSVSTGGLLQSSCWWPLPGTGAPLATHSPAAEEGDLPIPDVQVVPWTGATPSGGGE
ncbi:CLCN7 [Cordylochernes scorpioides]|uniref:CLCN7 n=1 Tax=Cordylochernes scorpioides TaxID=51811 RepID=A0ABY6JYP6_9ARAC|nr:CLCN7 [Cordylochernes scorpioides]